MGEEWRTLTFGDLRPGDVIKVDEDGPEETVRTVVDTPVRGQWARVTIRTDLSVIRPQGNALVLVRHPRPQGDET